MIVGFGLKTSDVIWVADKALMMCEVCEKYYMGGPGAPRRPGKCPSEA